MGRFGKLGQKRSRLRDEGKEVMVDKWMDSILKSQGFNIPTIGDILPGHFRNHKSLSVLRGVGLNM